MTSERFSREQSIVVDAPAGCIAGWRDGEVIRATGIPYARAERFEKPVPVNELGSFEAREWSPSAPQNAMEEPPLFGPELRDLGVSEDCQNLSITIPGDLREGEKLPVIVWIHGGSYVAGAGDSSFSDPARWVAERRVIVVTVSYRLGVLGFLGSSLGPANLGLLDQAEAFRWVRRNISSFGGDAARVTALGESAGADAILHHAAAMGRAILDGRDEELLFDRAIALSPPLGIREGRSRMNALSARILEKRVRRESPIEDLLAAQKAIETAAAPFGYAGSMPFGVQYGHDPLPPEESVLAAWHAIAPKVPLLISAVGTESSFFAHSMPFARFLRGLPRLGERAYWTFVDSASRAVFTKDIAALSDEWGAAGGVAHRAVVPWSVPGNPFGSPHVTDIALLFSREDSWRSALPFEGATWEEIDRAGADLRRYFTEFASGESDHPLTREPRAIRGHAA
ncbi:carboxylesterase family protein [Dermabacter vaginalis]|uniref:carboxylesterase family protein n=1 Tax=Dermabacter vaginalis TaxID=1630135 RepID=UPI00168997F5|nr:carboxylesterase family protein [Dermabacter vaginalis]